MSFSVVLETMMFVFGMGIPLLGIRGVFVMDLDLIIRLGLLK